MKKVKKAYHKEQDSTVQKLYENKPIYTLDHIVKERSVNSVGIKFFTNCLKGIHSIP